VTGIYVNRADDDVSDSRLKYRICAWKSASFCGARFQCNVKRRSDGWWRTEIAKAFNLSVLAAGSPMMSSRDDSIADYENRANRGIRASLAERFLCLVECRVHELFVSCSTHRLGKSIVGLARRGNAASLGPWHSPPYQNINSAWNTAVRPD
jgi:hypothetical protein